MHTDTRKRISLYSDIGELRNPDTPRHFGYLQSAFELHRLARLTRNDVERARYILGANVLLTAIEQDLADLAVRVVIDHVPKRVRATLEQRAARVVSAYTDMPRQVVELEIPAKDAGAMALLDTAWSRLMTDQILVMALPTETLRLGRDIPPREAGKPFYPTALQNLEFDPAAVNSARTAALLALAQVIGQCEAENKPADAFRATRDQIRQLADDEVDELLTSILELVERIRADNELVEFLAPMLDLIAEARNEDTARPTVPLSVLDGASDDPEKSQSQDAESRGSDGVELRSHRGAGRGSGATDWRQYDDRLNWAVALIRSRQDDATLYWPPFSCSDEERIVSRRLPERGGDPSDLEVLPPLDGEAYVTRPQ